jgi:ubiquinone/menaquinone biosynthesis C-methylase UbiE
MHPEVVFNKIYGRNSKMTGPDYEYHGMMAQTWDLFRGDTSDWEDRHFFLELIHESGQPVLDVGCGTGRLLVDYQSQGIDIDGLDNSPDMLALCRKKAQAAGIIPTLYKGSMESMDLPRQYQTILVPSSSFQLVVDPLNAEQAIKRFYEHLLPGGTLVMPFMILWKEGFDSSWRQTGEKIRSEDGAMVKRWSRNHYDSELQLEHTEDRYEVIKDGVIIANEYHVRSPATRQYTQEQTHDLYSKAGFVDIRIYKNFTRLPASADDEVFTVLGRKPGENVPG